MQDLVDAICKPPRSEDDRASFEHDRVPELLRLIGQRELVAPESSSARARIDASAKPQSSGLGDISALGQGPERFDPRRDGSNLRYRRQTAYPYGDPLAAEALAPSPRRQQVSARQARESALQPPAVAPRRSRPWRLTTAAWDRRPDRRTRRAVLHLQYSCASPCGPATLVTQDPERRGADSDLVATGGATVPISVAQIGRAPGATNGASRVERFRHPLRGISDRSR
jgi:hypothetical protein